ncbi:MAG: hypothetical protein ACLFR2_12380 [Candidatus Kapaibacterium sp.]
MMKLIFFTLFILITGALEAISQHDDYNEVEPRDTVVFRYKFNVGDTLYYRVVSHDSIIIDYGEPLLKSRYERIRITCDSINDVNHYILGITLVDYLAHESKGDVRGVRREHSPWLDRTVWIEMDFYGNRYSYRIDDTSQAAMAPGSAFQPFLLINFVESHKAVNESWMVKDSIHIAENGYPPPVLRYSSLFRAKESIDTLGYMTNKAEYIRTAQGSMELITDQQKIAVASIHNSWGFINMSKELFIPVSLYQTSELKLNIQSPDQPDKPGWHYIEANYMLDVYKPADPPDDADEDEGNSME